MVELLAHYHGEGTIFRMMAVLGVRSSIVVKEVHKKMVLVMIIAVA